MSTPSVRASVEPSILIAANSDSIYHGISESSDDPSIAINVEFQLTPNLISGVQLQEAITSDVRQRHRNLTAYIGYDHKISDNWLSSTYYTHRAFIDSQRQWDYDEFTAQFSHKSGVSFGTFYAPNYYASSVKSVGVNAQYFKTLPDNFYWKAKIASINIPTLFNYQYANLAIGKNIKRVNIELGYHWTSDTRLQTPVGNIDSPGLVLRVNYFAF